MIISGNVGIGTTAPEKALHIVGDGVGSSIKIDDTGSGSAAVEMYIENNGGFEGDQTLMSKFGLEIRDQATFIVARRSWERFVGIFNNEVNSIRPLEGDIIYYPLSKSFFEIKFVEHQQPFYQLNNLVVFKLQCELFEYSNEIFDTGNPDVDAVQTYSAVSTVIRVALPYDDSELLVGEQIVQGVADGIFINAEITNVVVDSEDPAKRIVWLSNITSSDGEWHDILNNFRIVGQASLSSWLIDRIYDINDTDVNFTFPQNSAQNQEFEIEADGIMDFSEVNPFGDPNDGRYFSIPDNIESNSISGAFTVNSTSITVDSVLITSDKTIF